MNYNTCVTPEEARKRIMGQGLNILRSISEEYAYGTFEDPQKAIGFCTLLMLIAEDKIKGSFNRESCKVEWTLNEKYQKKLEETRESILASKIIPGPWV
jgi:hypothetical protein